MKGEPRVAIVADWLTVYGGAESVIESFTRLFPTAPIFTTVFVPERMKELGKHADVRTSFLQHLPARIRKKHPFLLPFLPRAIESLDVSAYDIILSSSSFLGKAVLTNPNQLHVCYCHSPARYFWGDWKGYLQYFPIPRLLKRFLPRCFTEYRQWDYFAAQRPDSYIANSCFIAKGIKKYYKRGSFVIPPPVDAERFHSGTREKKQDWYLGFGRLVPQKNFELLIRAFKMMPEKKLKIAGTGRNEKALKKLAGNARNIEFLGFVHDDFVPEMLGRAKALLFPQVEDAGITPLEALSSGTPVIAYGKGGVLSTLIDGETGVFIDKQTPKSLIEGIEKFESIEKNFSRKDLAVYAQQFSRDTFEKSIYAFLERRWAEHSKSRKILKNT